MFQFLNRLEDMTVFEHAAATKTITQLHDRRVTGNGDRLLAGTTPATLGT